MIESFEYDKEKNLEENIDSLGQIIMANSFFIIERVGKHGKKASKKELDAQEELNRQFKLISKTYTDMKKMNRVSNNSSNTMSREIVDRIKQMTSTLGKIVTRVPKE